MFHGLKREHDNKQNVEPSMSWGCEVLFTSC